MPWNPKDYPDTWKTFSRYMRVVVAENRCQCTGECGLHCTHPGPRRCVEMNHTPAQWAKGRVVLTVAHLCTCQPKCAIEAHCKAMCNKCHMRVDRFLHAKHAAETRRKKVEALGQIRLFDVSPKGETRK